MWNTLWKGWWTIFDESVLARYNGAMLSQPYRLKARQVRLVFERGRFVPGPFVSVKVLHLPDVGASRFGVVAGVKLSKQATVRNRARRRLRHALRGGVGQCKPGFGVVLLARAPVLRVPFNELTDAVGAQLKKAGVLAQTERGQ